MTHEPTRHAIWQRAIVSLALIMTIAAWPRLASAATLTWDADGTTTTGSATDGGGAWLGASQWWNGSSNVSWTSGDDAVFGVGGTGGAVTLSATTTAGSLTFNPFSGTYALGTAGQALTLGSGGLTMNAGAGAVTLVSPVTLGAAQIWTNDSASLFTTSAATTNAGHLLTVTGSGNASLAAVSGVGGLAKSGSGTLTLAGANTYSGGTIVSGGMLTLATGSVSGYWNGVIRGSLTISNGATVNATQAWSLGAGGPNSPQPTTRSVTAITLTGGTIAGASFGWINSNTLTPTLRTLVSATRSTLEGGISLRLSSTGTLTFDVASGSTADGIDLLVSGPIVNSTVAGGDNSGGVIAKAGPGTLALAAANTFTGSTSIAAGRLQVDSTGSFTATSGITLTGGELRYNSATPLARPLALTAGTISGTGTIATPVTVATGGVLSPGNSPGTQAYSQGLTWSGSGSYLWELNALSGTAGVNWDVINVSGGTFDLSGLTAGSRFILDLTTLTGANAPGPLAVPFDGGSYTFLIASYATLSSTLGTAALTDLTSLFDIRLNNWASPTPALPDVSVRINSAANGLEVVIVPEPGAVALAAIGTFGVAWALRRRRRHGERNA